MQLWSQTHKDKDRTHESESEYLEGKLLNYAGFLKLDELWGENGSP